MNYKLLFMLLIISSNLFAQDPDTQIDTSGVGGLTLSPMLGLTTLNVDADYSLNSSSHNDTTVKLGLLAGYQTAGGLALEVGYVYNSSIDLFGLSDNSDLKERVAVISFKYDIGPLNLIPQYGYSWWELKSTEGGFLNPGPEAARTIEGTDRFWALRVEKTFTSRFSLYWTFKKSNYEFGQVTSGDIGVKYIVDNSGR